MAMNSSDRIWLEGFEIWDKKIKNEFVKVILGNMGLIY